MSQAPRKCYRSFTAVVDDVIAFASKDRLCLKLYRYSLKLGSNQEKLTHCVFCFFTFTLFCLAPEVDSDVIFESAQCRWSILRRPRVLIIAVRDRSDFSVRRTASAHADLSLLYTRSKMQSSIKMSPATIAAVSSLLTLWRPLLPYVYSYKASCARLTGLSRHL